MKRLTLLLLAILGTTAVLAQRGNPPQGSLKPVVVPKPTNIAQYVRDEAMLIALGKALFWDVQVGSDGQTACASCHFHAGADHRVQNQLAPPHVVGTGDAIRANATVTLEDFPFRKLTNPLDRNSQPLRNSRQVFGSAGVVRREYAGFHPGLHHEDAIESEAAAPFAIGGSKTRQVTSRNTPSVINAVYYVRNFWDGRAREDAEFTLRVQRVDALEEEIIRLDHASLATQAIGPPLNDVEMSYKGRTWPALARKLYALPPLARQSVAADDSVLGSLASPEGRGLAAEHSYPSLIRAAFPERYTSDAAMEDNFAFFFGLALQAYQSTLVSNDTPFDRFIEGNAGAMTALQQQGMRAFQDGRSECLHCHQGPEFSGASFSSFRAAGGNPNRLADLGFFRTGVSPIEEDAGITNGLFKSPSLRNVELTGPYFHDGGQATLAQVLEFYARRSDFPQGGLGPGMNNITLSPQDRTAMLAFFQALTDDRVRFERAPFDHPSLCIAVGHDEGSAQAAAPDRWALIPAVGRAGGQAPLQTFEELLQGIGADGSRAHSLTESCTP
jgi:cytochrome c peroxidase